MAGSAECRRRFADSYSVSDKETNGTLTENNRRQTGGTDEWPDFGHGSFVKHRIARQMTAPCVFENPQEALTEICRELDIPCPLWLNKHEREFEDFRHTAFLPEHFMEEVPFQKLEIEFLDDTGVKRRSNDPRNQFDGF